MFMHKQQLVDVALCCCCSAIFLFVTSTSWVYAQGDEKASNDTTNSRQAVRQQDPELKPTVIDDSSIVAIVGDQEITFAAIESLLTQRFGFSSSPDHPMSQAELTMRQAAAASLVNRELAIQRILQLGGTALEASIKQTLDNQSSSLRRADPEARLEQHQMRSLAWDVAWNWYLKQQLTDENLEKFYKAQAWKFDGTKVHASQIFLPHSDRAFDELAKIKERIKTGDIDFATAARRFSNSPSAANGGVIGWVEYLGDLPPELSDEAFSAELKSAIGPVRSSAGWHLLWVDQRTPGNEPFEKLEDRAALQQAATGFLFNRLVKAGAEQFEVRWVSLDLKPPATTDIQP